MQPYHPSTNPPRPITQSIHCPTRQPKPLLTTECAPSPPSTWSIASSQPPITTCPGHDSGTSRHDQAQPGAVTTAEALCICLGITLSSGLHGESTHRHLYCPADTIRHTDIMQLQTLQFCIIQTGLLAALPVIRHPLYANASALHNFTDSDYSPFKCPLSISPTAVNQQRIHATHHRHPCSEGHQCCNASSQTVAIPTPLWVRDDHLQACTSHITVVVVVVVYSTSATAQPHV